MSTTGLLLARPRKSAHDGTRTNAGPSFVADATSLQFGGAGNAKSAFLQFPTRLPTGATVTAATLKLKAALTASAGGTHTLKTLDFATDGLDVTAGAATPIASATAAGEAWTAGTWYSYDVTALVTAALLVRNLLTFQLDTDEATAREFYALDQNWLAAAVLEITFTYEDTEDNPYTLALQGVWALLESNPYFAALVPQGNRIKHLSDMGRAPDQENPATADYPLVRVLPRGGTPLFSFSSSQVKDDLVYEVQLLAGDQRLDSVYYPLKFAVMRALQDNNAMAIRAIKWRGKVICLQTESLQASEMVDNFGLAQGIKGWIGLWSIKIPLLLPIAEL